MQYLYVDGSWQQMEFQQDGAAPYFCDSVRIYVTMYCTFFFQKPENLTSEFSCSHWVLVTSRVGMPLATFVLLRYAASH